MLSSWARHFPPILSLCASLHRGVEMGTGEFMLCGWGGGGGGGGGTLRLPHGLRATQTAHY